MLGIGIKLTWNGRIHNRTGRLMKRTNKQGGKREGAGRPKTKEATIVMRIPESFVPAVKKLIKDKK